MTTSVGQARMSGQVLIASVRAVLAENHTQWQTDEECFDTAIHAWLRRRAEWEAMLAKGEALIAAAQQRLEHLDNVSDDTMVETDLNEILTPVSTTELPLPPRPSPPHHHGHATSTSMLGRVATIVTAIVVILVLFCTDLAKLLAYCGHCLDGDHVIVVPSKVATATAAAATSKLASRPVGDDLEERFRALVL